MKTQGKVLSAEDSKTLDQYEGICRSVFLQARQNLKMIANISGWAPHAFFFGDFRKRLSSMLNYFLKESVNPKLINLNVNHIKILK